MTASSTEALINEIFCRRQWAGPIEELLQEITSGRYGDVFAYLIPFLQDPVNNDLAFEIMMWIDSTRAMEYALPLIRESPWQFTICYLIARLGGSSLLIDAVIEVLMKGEDAGTRVMAVHALERIGDERAIKYLIAAYENDHELDSGGWSASSCAIEAIKNIQARIEQGNGVTSSEKFTGLKN